MATLNAVIQPERQTTTTLVTKLRDGSYFVDNTFQRRLVWTEKQKVRLIETILMGFPMPEIYLWQQPADPETGSQGHSIVDGQQRLTTMMQFVANEWKLKAKHLEAEHRNKSYANCYWKDLQQEEKQLFWDYVVNTRVIPNSVKGDTIVRIFTRLNETDRSLNPQEIRNAKFSGKFIEAAEQVADLPIWGECKIFSSTQIRRMADVAFATSLLIYLRKGSIEESQEAINEIYDLYNDKYVERNRDIKTIESFADALEKDYKIKSDEMNLFRREVHLYTLFCVEQRLDALGINLRKNTELLRAFAEDYLDPKHSNSLIEAYRKGASSRTRSKNARNSRTDALVGWLQNELKKKNRR